MDFSSGPPSSSVLLTRIPEIDVKSMGGISNSEDGTLDYIQTKDEAYVSGYGDGSWDDSSILSDNFLRGLGDGDRSTFPNIDLSESQNEGRSRPPSTLTHHLSLPTSSSELFAMEKLMQYQGFVPLRSRARRGCATHPRSIAERKPRTTTLDAALRHRAAVQCHHRSRDRKAIIINRQRRILISGSIHYPRSTPEIWEDLIVKAKDGGLDMIRTYVFWNGHKNGFVDF